jgi:chromosome segregation ATPase
MVDSDRPVNLTQYEFFRDGHFHHLDHIDDDYRRASQKHHTRANQTSNFAAENGIIHTIECTNFMCHQRLIVEFGPLINFVVGENGSGKSAVLTALTLCLGGKASSTNRGGTLKKFIKEGCEQSIIAVKLKNEGQGAYQPLIYGRIITIERHLSRNGASGFKLRNYVGKIVSSRKTDVEDVTEWFCLQMDNPLSVLSQDNARQFLNSSTPGQKYRFFVEGVQLEQLDSDYKLVMGLSEDLENKLCRVVNIVQDAVDAFDEARKLEETVAQGIELREQARHYINQLAWAKVAEKEQSLAAYTADLERLVMASSDGDGLVTVKCRQVDHAEQQLSSARLALDEILPGESVSDGEVRRTQREYDQAKTDLQRVHAEYSAQHQSWEQKISVVKEIEEEIEKEQRKTDVTRISARAAKEEELDMTQDALRADISRREDAKTELVILDKDISERRTELVRIRTEELARIEEEISQCHLLIEELTRDATSIWAGYPAGMDRLVEQIAHDPMYHDKPIGPIGRLLQFNQPNWADLIEACLGDALDSFIVTCVDDQRRLAVSASRLNISCQIIISHANPLDLSTQDGSPIETIYRVCTFLNPAVRDQLIIAHSIDKTGLADSKEEAYRDLQDQNYLTSAITYKNDRRSEGVIIRKNQSNDLNIRPIGKLRGRHPRVKSDVTWRAETERERARQLSLSLSTLQRQEDELRQEVDNLTLKRDRLKSSGAQIESTIAEKQLDVLKIRQQLDDMIGADGCLEALNSQLQQRQAEAANEGAQFGLIEIHRSELNARVEDLRNRSHSARAAHEEFLSKLRDIETRVRNYDDARKIAIAERDGAMKERDDSYREKAHLADECQRISEEVKVLTAEAMQCHDHRLHLQEGENVNSIERRFETIQAQLKQRERIQGYTDEEIYERTERARATLDSHQRTESAIRRELEQLKISLSQRLEKWRIFQRQITARTRVQFSYLLSERRYRGDILFDHPARLLALAVEPDETQIVPGTRNTRTLSGGEKSFASICMLLAIWEAMGSPIRCLDEFDVFMDNVNRAISTNMLVSYVPLMGTR